jgi:protein tyrosine phosphatase (PTP) superfamily phosphohydrolase (DUF442 family)
MFNLPSLLARGTPRGTPGLPGGPGRRLLVAVAALALVLPQTGCRSGLSSQCGGSGGFLTRTTSRIMSRFHRDRGECCGTEVVADGCSGTIPVEGVVAAPVVVPNAVITPAPAFGTPSTVAPLDSPTNLDPIGPETRPESRPGPAPGSIRRSPTGTRSNSSYDSMRPDLRSTQSGSDNLAHTLIANPVPAPGSAQDASRRGGQAEADRTFDNLPPLDLPGEVTEKGTTPPVSPAAERKPQTPAPAGAPLGGRSPRENDLTLTGTPAPGSDPTSTAGPVPGIERFVAVDLKLAGGTTPTVAGLDWLAEKGYRTVVDLRESSETDVAFIAEVTRRGLRYIALPVGARGFDREQVARFNFEVGAADARPLYFFDTLGTRAGALWYIRRITVDQLDSQVARREAQDLGCGDGPEWLAATSYLDRLNRPRPQPAETPRPAVAAPAPAAEKAPKVGFAR